MVSQVLQIRRIVDKLLIYCTIQHNLIPSGSYHIENRINGSKQRNNADFYFR